MGALPSQRDHELIPTTTAPPRLASTTNSLARISAILLHLGLFLTSLLTLRVSGVTYGDLFIGASALTLALSRDDRRPCGSPPAWAWVALYLTALGTALATYRADSAAGTVLVGLRLIFLIGILPWQLRRVGRIDGGYGKSVGWWAAGTALCGLGTGLQYLGVAIPGAAVSDAGRYSGFTAHVSDTGGICSAGAAIFVASVLGSSNFRSRAVNILGLLGCGLGIILSGSVSALLGLAIVFVYIIARGRFRLGGMVATLAGVYVVYTLAGSLQAHTTNALNPVERIKQVFGQYQSVPGQASLNTSASRLQTDRAGWSGFLIHPILGRGLDPASTIIDRADDLPVHDIIIGALYGGGLVLGFAIAIPILVALVTAVRMDRTDSLGTRVACCYLAALFFALTGPSIFNRYFWVPLAFAIVANHSDAGASAIPNVRPISGRTKLFQPNRNLRETPRRTLHNMPEGLTVS